MKEGWEIKKLGDVLLKTEQVDPTKNPEKEFTYIDISSLNRISKEIEGATSLKGRNAPSRARKVVKKDDIIFATVRPTLSRVTVITDVFDNQICSTGYFVLRSNGSIFNRYLFYFLLSSEFSNEMELLQKGANYPAVTDAEIKNCLIQYPKKISEQQLIVSTLDSAFTAIAKAKANAEQNLKNAKELFESYLQGVFEKKDEGWEIKSLGEIAEVQYGYTDKSREDGDYRYVRITDINNDGELIPRNKKYVTHSKEATCFLLKDNDLLMARTGATFAKVLFYKEMEPSIFASYLIRITFKVEIDNEFYWYFTKTKTYWDQANALQSGAAQPHFNGAAVKQVIFAYPKSIHKQRELINKFHSLSIQSKKLEASYLQKLVSLEELKKSILQKAFSGELKTAELLPA